jgi:cytidylate kinase
MCSFGDEIAEALSRKLGWELITRNDLFVHFPDIAQNAYDMRMLTESAKYYLSPAGGKGTFLETLTKRLTDYLEDNSAVLVGFGSQMIFKDSRDALHLRIMAPKDVRVLRAKKQYRVSHEEAERILETADKKHRKFVTTVFEADLSDPALYNLIINTATLSVEESVSCIVSLLKERETKRKLEFQTGSEDIPESLTDRPLFKNQSEEEFAAILDMYQIEWKYEPKTFPIEWDAEGNITMAFSPDFYLTKFDTYIELTTMNQKYVTHKNKKMNKLRELYPGTNIKIVYKKDFYTLLERFKPE